MNWSLPPSFARLTPLFFIFTLSSTLSACGAKDATPASSAAGASGEVPAPIADSKGEMVYPDGWEKIELVANFAKTRITSSAHFITSRNACGKDADGALTMEVWNQLATDLNAVVREAPSKQLLCKDRPENSKMDGTAEIRLSSGGKRMIIESKGNWEYCTDIQDATLAERVFNEISLLVLIADREECAGGWGSGS